MENKALTVLEYDKILVELAQCAVSPNAKRQIADLIPVFDMKEAERLQELTFQASVLKDRYLINPIYELDDVIPILEKANVGVTLLPSDFLKIAKVLRAAYNARKAVSQCGEDVVLLKDRLSVLTPNMDLEKRIGDTIAGENEIKDSASETLRTLRRKLAALSNKLKDKLQSYTRSGETEKYLQDNIVTVRDGRFVLPVKAECKSGVPGLIHDRSASGSTIYVEPFPIVELNNEMRTLQLMERDEIERILRSLSSDVSQSSLSINLCFDRLIELDVLFAKAVFATGYRGVRPSLNNRGIVRITNGRHPLIPPDTVVPVSVAFGEQFNIVVITGPNTGGKTVSLKTVGLFCLMSYSGLYLPCDEGAEIALFDNVYCDIGDDQSIAQSLSTFSSHIINMARITDAVTPDSLVLLDEIGAGTDPVEGAALAVGILKYLELMNCHGVVTTHYSELKEYALTSEKLINACMQFDEKTLKPTYRLIMGLPGVSNALEISKNLGLNDFILDNARASLKDEKIQFEKVLSAAEQARSKAMAELEEVYKLKADLIERQQKLDQEHGKLSRKLEQINNNAKIETQKIVRGAVEKADEILEQIKEQLQKADEAALLQAKKLQKSLEAMQYETRESINKTNYLPLSENELKIGNEVLVKSLNAKGYIRSMPNKKGLIGVSSGSVSISVPISDLAKVVSPAPSVNKKTAHRAINSGEKNQIETLPVEELKVLGMTVSEALEVIEPHIQSIALSEDKAILKVVHGKGTGALGKGIQSYLRSCPQVKSYRYGRYGEGDNGVTFIEIK